MAFMHCAETAARQASACARAGRHALVAGWIAGVLAHGAHAAQAQVVYRHAGADGVPVYTEAPASRNQTGEAVLVVTPLAARVFAAGGAAASLARQPKVQDPGDPATPQEHPAPRWKFLPQLDRVIAVIADRNGVEAALVRAVIEVESAFNLQARSRAGAVGLMQLMPAMASRYGVTDAQDPIQNVEAGTRYLRDLLRMFDGDARLALAAYNAGEGAVLRYQRNIPPFEETQRYVPAVIATRDRNRFDGSLPRLVPAGPPR